LLTPDDVKYKTLCAALVTTAGPATEDVSVLVEATEKQMFPSVPLLTCDRVVEPVIATVAVTTAVVAYSTLHRAAMNIPPPSVIGLVVCPLNKKLSAVADRIVGVPDERIVTAALEENTKLSFAPVIDAVAPMLMSDAPESAFTNCTFTRDDVSVEVIVSPTFVDVLPNKTFRAPAFVVVIRPPKLRSIVVAAPTNSMLLFGDDHDQSLTTAVTDVDVLPKKTFRFPAVMTVDAATMVKDDTGAAKNMFCPEDCIEQDDAVIVICDIVLGDSKFIFAAAPDVMDTAEILTAAFPSPRTSMFGPTDDIVTVPAPDLEPVI